MTELPTRRAFLAVGTAAVLAAGAQTANASPGLPDASFDKLPRWRGFNLLEKFNGANKPFNETDFAMIRELGFNFVRLPMDYRMWIEGKDWTKFHEPTLKEIDAAVALGEKHGVHTMINFHRAPGYTVAEPYEEKSLWTDPEAQQVCALHWAHFAKRYQGIPNSRVSFNLLNEPAVVGAETHRKAIGILCEAIRVVDPERLIVCDGRMWGRTPPEELLELKVAAATRGYEPMQISHYKAGWVKGADAYPVPTWPLKIGDKTIDENSLAESGVTKWKEVQSKGMGVMVGEFGAFNQTPHDVVLDWMKVCIRLWRDAGWGYAMWNFRGSFGILDSERADVKYEDWKGHKLDRKMLELLKA
jgi:endoglucanase